MYVRSLIETINKLDEQQYKSFSFYAFNYHKEYLKNESLRHNDFEKYLKKFIDGKTTKITFENLDSYLYGLDQLKFQENKQTGTDSIFKWKKSWRELLFEVTEIDYPREFNPSYIDESNIEIVKSVLESFLIASMGESKEESSKRLNILNEFIKTYINV